MSILCSSVASNMDLGTLPSIDGMEGRGTHKEREGGNETSGVEEVRRRRGGKKNGSEHDPSDSHSISHYQTSTSLFHLNQSLNQPTSLTPIPLHSSPLHSIPIFPTNPAHSNPSSPSPLLSINTYPSINLSIKQSAVIPRYSQPAPLLLLPHTHSFYRDQSRR